MTNKFVINEQLIVDVAANELQACNTSLNGQVPGLKLENMLINILVQLSEHANEVVSRQHFISSVWANNNNVGNPALTKAISKLRKILKDQFDQEDLIETVPKKGYRLKAKVRPVSMEKASLNFSAFWQKITFNHVIVFLLVAYFILKLIFPEFFHGLIHQMKH